MPEPGMEIAAVTMEMVHHKELAKYQETCQDVLAHKNNKLKGLNMGYVKYSPGVELYCHISEQGRVSKPLVPKSWRRKVIAMYHDLAHGGQKETADKVSRRYYWPSLVKDINNYVKFCMPCQQVKQYRQINPLHSTTKVPDKRFSHLQVDIVGPLRV